MVRSKVESYIGFCVKSGAVTFGAGAISCLKGGVKLLLLSGDAAANSVRLALKFKRRFGCPLVVCGRGLEPSTGRDCKLAAIKDAPLAEAILKNLDNNYQLYVGGNE